MLIPLAYIIGPGQRPRQRPRQGLRQNIPWHSRAEAPWCPGVLAKHQPLHCQGSGTYWLLCHPGGLTKQTSCLRIVPAHFLNLKKFLEPTSVIDTVSDQGDDHLLTKPVTFLNQALFISPFPSKISVLGFSRSPVIVTLETHPLCASRFWALPLEDSAGS